MVLVGEMNHCVNTLAIYIMTGEGNDENVLRNGDYDDDDDDHENNEGKDRKDRVNVNDHFDYFVEQRKRKNAMDIKKNNLNNYTEQHNHQMELNWINDGNEMVFGLIEIVVIVVVEQNLYPIFDLELYPLSVLQLKGQGKR